MGGLRDRTGATNRSRQRWECPAGGQSWRRPSRKSRPRQRRLDMPCASGLAKQSQTDHARLTRALRLGSGSRRGSLRLLSDGRSEDVVRRSDGLMSRRSEVLRGRVGCGSEEVGQSSVSWSIWQSTAAHQARYRPGRAHCRAGRAACRSECRRGCGEEESGLEELRRSSVRLWVCNRTRKQFSPVSSSSSSDFRDVSGSSSVTLRI